ncbi:MAG: hypothetical protein ACRDY2_03240 [Acidimicrobiales bacterium]
MSSVALRTREEGRATPRTGRLKAALPPLTVVVLVAGTHVWLTSHMHAPIVQADEFGYLYGAHFLALGGPHPATAACTTICAASPYYPGYSLLLAPLWLASQATSTVYHAALDLNTALAAVSAWLVYVLAGRLAPSIGGWTRALVALVVAAYPSYLGFGNVVESENLLLPAYVATCLLARRAFDRSAGAPALSWAALGLVGGLLYMVHPSALAVTVAVAVVGAWVAIAPTARPWPGARAALARVVPLAAGLAAGLVASQQVITYVTSGGPSNTAGFFSAIGNLASLHGVAHLGVNAAGQLLYLLAVTGGLVVLAVPLLARATAAVLRRPAGDRGGDPASAAAGAGPEAGQRRLGLVGTAGSLGAARTGVLTLVAATSVVMGAVSVLSLGTGGAGRLDVTFYGRYNEAVLAPVLVAGALVGIGLGTRRGTGRGRRRIGAWALPGGLAALAITAAAVAAARGGVLRGTPQATNVLAAHAIFRASAPSSISLLALAGLGAAVLVVVLAAWRLNLALAGAILVASFVPSAAAGLSDLSAQSVNVATEQAVPSALVALSARFGPGLGHCVAFDTSGSPADAGFSYFDYRLYDPTQAFVPFASASGGRPCSAEVVSGRANLASALAGAKELVAGQPTGEALWVLPGPLQDRLALAGRLAKPPG